MSEAATVAIIGGGFSGAAVAFNLSRSGAPATIVVYEPRAELGAGLAYDTDEPVHRINVPASKMSLDPDDPDGFVRWLAANPAAVDPAAALADGRSFPQRRLFGAYVRDQLAPFLADGAVRHVRDTVAHVMRAGEGWVLRLDDGSARTADLVVIATSHPAPTPPAGLAAIADDPRLVADPLRPGALDAVAADARVLIVGTGLTMADTVAALDRRGHAGPILAVSRRGQRSQGHGDAPSDGIGDFATRPSLTALALLRRVRAVVRDAAAAGHSWHGVIDAVRRQGGAIWAALPLAERRRLLRHLRPFWDTHRFRIAPQVEAVLDRRIAAGTLSVRAAAPVAAAASADALAVDLRGRGGATETLPFDAVVVTTGPGHAALLRSQSFLARLAADGFVRDDPLRLGLDCDPAAHAVGRDGVPVPSLFVAGPLARGQFGELMGLPEVAVHARTVAHAVLAALAVTAPAAQTRARRA